MTEEKKVEKGNVIKVDYIGKFDDGEVFDSSKHGDHSHPLEFEVGSGKVIKGFDEAVVGMKVGESKEFSVESNEAYGEYKAELKREIPKEQLPKEQDPKVGMVLVMQTPDGQQFPAKITNVGEKNITVDLNHPLAGKKLNFTITIAEISDKKEEVVKEASEKKKDDSLEDLTA